MATTSSTRVVYTGTHDHDTVRGWYESIRPERRALVDRSIDEAGVREAEPWWSLIRLAFASPARVAMVQAQDVLGLGSEARMNVPGRRALVAVGPGAAVGPRARLRGSEAAARQSCADAERAVDRAKRRTPQGSSTGRRRPCPAGPLRRAPRRVARTVDAVRERGCRRSENLRLA